MIKSIISIKHGSILIFMVKSTTMFRETQQAQMKTHITIKYFSLAPCHGAPSLQKSWLCLWTLFIKTSSMVASNPERDNSSSFLNLKSFGYFGNFLFEEYERTNNMALLIIVWKNNNKLYKSLDVEMKLRNSCLLIEKSWN
jgi:hypothetical protein